MFDDFELGRVSDFLPRWRRSLEAERIPVDTAALAAEWIREEQFLRLHPDYSRPDDWEWDTPQDVLFSLTHDHPEIAWEVICELAATAPEEILADVGVGPIETFLNKNAETFIDRIESRAKEDGRFRSCLYEASPAFGGPVLNRLASAVGLEFPK